MFYKYVCLKPCSAALPGRDRHEQSKYHLRAVHSEANEELPVCKGLSLNLVEAHKTLLGDPSVRPILDVWISSGCIQVVQSALESFQVSRSTLPNGEENVVIQDQGCLKEPGLCIRGCSACQKCFGAADRKKAWMLIREWSLRICMVDLCHLSIGADTKARRSQCDFIKEHFPESRSDDLESMSYPDLLARC